MVRMWLLSRVQPALTPQVKLTFFLLEPYVLGFHSLKHILMFDRTGKLLHQTNLTYRLATLQVGSHHSISPSLLTASTEFRFYPQNHSVVKGEFGHEPCIPYELTGAGKVGWWSGWMPTAVVDSNNQPTYQVRINDTDPLSIYCSSPGSCILGMLVVINGVGHTR